MVPNLLISFFDDFILTKLLSIFFFSNTMIYFCVQIKKLFFKIIHYPVQRLEGQPFTIYIWKVSIFFFVKN